MHSDPEHRSGRMLFTDFDASGKERPVAVLEAAPAPEFLTLDEIADQLDFAFEDDGEEPAPGQSLDKTPGHVPEPPEKAAVPEPAVPAPPDDGDAELELTLPDFPAAGPAVLSPASASAAAAPSWDDFARAFEQAKPVESIAPLRAPGASAPADDEDGMLDDVFTEDVDVLSMLDVLLEHERRPGTAAPDAPAAADPERGAESSARRSTTTRIVAPPRALPYGGIERIEDWFSPPENQPGEVARVADWYAPPEENADGSVDTGEQDASADGGDGDDPGETKVDISWLSDFNNELPEGDYRRKKTTRLLPGDASARTASARLPGVVKRAGERADPGETMELFSDMDFGALWEKKVAEKRQSRPAPDDGTREISLFDKLDVDTLWEKKKEEARTSGRLKNLPPDGELPGGGEKTVIVDRDQLLGGGGADAGAGAGGTVILSRDLPRPRALRPDDTPPSAPELESVLAELDGIPLPPPRTTKSSRRTKPRPPPAHSAEEGAEDGEEDILASVSGDAGPRAGEPEPAKRADGTTTRQKDAAGKIAERSAADRENAERSGSAADAENTAGENPASGDSPDSAADPGEDGDFLPGDPEGELPAGPAGADAASSAAADADFDADSLAEEAAGAGVGGRVFGDGRGRAGGEAEEGEFVARTPPGSSGKSGPATDDLLDGPDGEDFAGEADDVAVPVIGDDAISDIGGEGGEDEAESSPAANIAVNPMDVFADMDNLDFSDDMDDDMRAMLDDEDAAANEDAADPTAGAEEAEEEIPSTRFGLLRFRAGKIAKKVLPLKMAEKALAMIAWRENWWFYCDLVAAVVASASMAVIISYLFWYRGT